MAYHKWTEEEIEYIRSIYPYYPNKIIVEMVKSKLGIDVSPRKLLNLRHKYKFPHKVNPMQGVSKKKQYLGIRAEKYPKRKRKK